MSSDFCGVPIKLLLPALLAACVVLAVTEYHLVRDLFVVEGDFFDDVGKVPFTSFVPRGVSIEDVLFVFPTSRDREPYIEIHEQSFLAKALRSGRHVYRIYVTSPNTTLPLAPRRYMRSTGNNFVWILTWPDNEPGPDSVPRAIRVLPGEQRMAMAFSLANETASRMGIPWKFMLYGDDDTFWNVDHVLQSHAAWIPDDFPVYAPIISGYYQFTRGARSLGALFQWLSAPSSICCLFACNGSSGYSGSDAGAESWPDAVRENMKRSSCLHPWQSSMSSSRFSKCSIGLMDWCKDPKCAALAPNMSPNLFSCASGERVFPAWDSSPHSPISYGLTTYFHGGFGSLFSRGLLRALDSKAYRACVREHNFLKGDNLIAQCVQSLAHILPSFPADTAVELSTRAVADAGKPPAEQGVGLATGLSVQFESMCIRRSSMPLTCHIKSPGLNGSINWTNYGAEICKWAPSLSENCGNPAAANGT